MLEELFLKILNMSYTASIVIVFVLIARLVLKKAPKVFSYSLWSVVLFRLLCPFSFESALSLLPKRKIPIVNAPINNPAFLPPAENNITHIGSAVSEIATNPTAPITPPVAEAPVSAVTPTEILTFIGIALWIIGIVLLLAYSAFSLVKLIKHLKSAKHQSENIFSSDRIEAPFVIGIFNPRIYLPSNLTEDEKRYILLHEQLHIKRFDHVIKIIAFLTLCLHWFNPLVWIAFFLCGKDMEMSCDEAVIKRMGKEVKKDYSSSLLTLATGRKIVGGTPLAFGEGNTKGRVKNVLNYKKPAFWVIVVAVLAVAAVSIGLIANPKIKEDQKGFALKNEEIAEKFAERWIEDYKNISAGKAALQGTGKGFLQDITGDGVPELFMLCDNYNLSEASVYDISGKNIKLLGIFPASSFYNEEPIYFKLYEGGGESLLYTEVTIYGPAASNYDQVAERYITLKNGKIEFTDLNRVEVRGENSAQVSYFDRDGSTPLTKEEYEEKKLKLLKNKEHTETTILGGNVPLCALTDIDKIRIYTLSLLNDLTPDNGEKTYNYGIMSAGPDDFAPIGCEYGSAKKGELTDQQMLAKLNNMQGHVFDEAYAWDGYVKFSFLGKAPQNLTLRYCATGGDIQIKEYPVEDDYKIKIPTEAGTYSFFADIRWDEENQETAYFRITVKKDSEGIPPDEFTKAVVSGMAVEKDENGNNIAKMSIPRKFPEGFTGKDVNITFMYNGPAQNAEEFGSFLNSFDLLENGVEAGKTYIEPVEKKIPDGSRIYARVTLFKHGDFIAENVKEWTFGDADGDGKIPLTDKVVAAADLGNKMSVQLVMLKGHLYPNYEAIGGGEYFFNYKGTYELRTIKDNKILSSISSDKLAPISRGGNTLNFGNLFELNLADYNGDGNQDFALGQYSPGSAMDYMLFTVDQKGKLDILKINGSENTFAARIKSEQGKMPFSPVFEKAGDKSFKFHLYNQSIGEDILNVASWDGKEFAIASATPYSHNGQTFSVTFPAYDQRTEFNKDVFDITPFDMQITLPKGYSIKKMENNPKGKYMISGLWNHLGIYNEQNKLIGSVGYNAYKDIDNEAPQAIYVDIALANHYQFDANTAYTKVKETAGGRTAVTDVYLSEMMAEQLGYEGDSEVTNHGILSYDRNRKVYIAVELDSTSLNKDEVTAIAKSVKFTDSEIKPGGNE